MPASGLAAEALYRHLVITADRVIAWYRLPLHSWSFRDESERLAIVQAAGARFTQLYGRRCHLRVTSRPYDVWQWAADFDTAVRGPSGPDGRRPRPAMPGPCSLHPYMSKTGCPSCVPGQAWIDFLKAQQRRLRDWSLAEREVYLGVEITARGAAQRLLGQAWGRAAAAERASLEQHADRVSEAVGGAGVYGRPVTPEELQWLYVRSCGIGLPAPLPASQDPQPVPYALPAAVPDITGPDGLAAWTEDYQWAAEPFGRSVEVTRAADGHTAHATVLTVTELGWQDLTGASPWIQCTDLMPFPVEWSVTFDVLDKRQVRRDMTKLDQRIQAQYNHIVEQGLKPPPEMARQQAQIAAIADDAGNPESAAGTYVNAWPRIAVTGRTPEEVRQRAAQVAERYGARGITVKQPPDQYRLLREFIPGEPLASGANRRYLHTETLAAGMPAATARAGQRHGFPVGATTSMAARPVLWDPWHLMENPNLNKSGLVTITGNPGGGKSTLAGLFAYMMTRAGVPSVVLDPSGMLDRLCRIPAIAANATAVNLLNSPPGTLCPYSLIPDPNPEDFWYDEDVQRLSEAQAREKWQGACRAAAAERRALTEDILKMLLPAAVRAQDGTDDAIGEAVRQSPATSNASPRDVIDALRGLTKYGLHNRGPLLASRLESTADHPLARLFFPPPDAPPAVAVNRRLLTVMTLRGLVIPDARRRPEDYSAEEQLSVPVLHLAAQLLRRLMLDLPRAARKAAFIDEAHAILRDAVGVQQVNQMTRDSRKDNTAAFLISQNPSDLRKAGIANLVGAAYAFRTEGPQELAATCELLGLPTGRGHEQQIEALSASALEGGTTGECLFRDGAGGLERIQVDLGTDPDLRAALCTTPGHAGQPAASSSEVTA